MVPARVPGVVRLCLCTADAAGVCSFHLSSAEAVGVVSPNSPSTGRGAASAAAAAPAGGRGVLTSCCSATQTALTGVSAGASMLSSCSAAASVRLRDASVSHDSSSIVLDLSDLALGVGGELGQLLEASAASVPAVTASASEPVAPACHLLHVGFACRAEVEPICLDKLREHRRALRAVTTGLVPQTEAGQPPCSLLDGCIHLFISLGEGSGLVQPWTLQAQQASVAAWTPPKRRCAQPQIGTDLCTVKLQRPRLCLWPRRLLLP